MNRQPSTIDRLPASAPASANASACPGLLRIVPARDGGICRVRLPGGRLSIEQALALADASARFGSGVLEVTNRANVQLRGVNPACETLLIDSLLAAGLGPTAAGVTAGADDVRNLLLSPAAGIDADSLLDVGPLAADILSLLQVRSDLHRLSPKFALQLDGGESVAMLEHPHDLWLSALPDGEHFAFGLAGCPPVGYGAAPALAAVPKQHVAELVEIALRLFLECAGPQQTRMRHLLETLPASEFLARLQARLSFPLRIDAALAQWRRVSPRVDAHIGIHAQRAENYCHVGAVPPLGRIDSLQLRALAELAREQGGELRMTPWQSVLLPNIVASAAPLLVQQLERLGFSCDRQAVLAHAIACSGEIGCARGRADTKLDARRLAEWLERRIETNLPAVRAVPSFHISGCERSCAAAHCAPFTLLAQSPGRYALYGRSAHDDGFGRLLAPSVDIETAGALIADAFFKNDSLPFKHDPETDA